VHPRASQLIRLLDLRPHPEGGWFREVWRSGQVVAHPGHGGLRPAGTAILFLLAEGHPSRWHRLASDEAWSFVEGAPADVFTADGGAAVARRLGRSGDGVPLLVVSAGSWQAGRTTGPYTLVSCTVAPGFDFTDFTLLRARPDALAALTAAGFDPLDLL
jgi:hypothetical protein